MLGAAVLLIANVTVIDGTGAMPGAPQSVLVRNGRIVAMGEVRAPRDAEVMDGTGKFLIPGLWDMHTHVLKDADRTFPKLLEAGVTGVRNMHVEAPESLAIAGGGGTRHETGAARSGQRSDCGRAESGVRGFDGCRRCGGGEACGANAEGRWGGFHQGV
jgi:hypothetical protein